MKTTTNLISSLAVAFPAKADLERRLVQMGVGIATAVRAAEMNCDQAGREFFNASNYAEAKRRRLSADVLEFLEWGMELEDVSQLAPEGLPESFGRMAALAAKVLRRPRAGGAGNRRSA